MIQPDPADDTFAFHVAVRSLAIFLGASVLAARVCWTARVRWRWGRDWRRG